MRNIIKKILKESEGDFDWARDYLDTAPKTEHEFVLARCFGEEKLTNLKKLDENHYYLDMYDNGEEVYAIGDLKQAKKSLLPYYKNLLFDNGFDDFIHIEDFNPSDYITIITDKLDNILNELTNQSLDDTEIQFLIEDSDYVDEWDKLYEEYKSLDKRLNYFIEDRYTKSFEDVAGEEITYLDSLIEDLRKSINSVLKKISVIENKIVEKAKIKFRESHRYSIIDNAYEYLVDDLMLYSSEEFLGLNFVEFDRELFLYNMVNRNEYEVLAYLSGEACIQEINNTEYVCMRVY
jgi:hypothetical protein